MARIFLMMSHCSHQNSTFLLARRLLQQDHQVFYCGPTIGIAEDNLAENAARQGFKFIAINLYGTPEPYEKNDPSQCLNEFIWHLSDGSIYEGFVREQLPDLIILDIHFMVLAMPFYHFQVPIILASTEILGSKDLYTPPLQSETIPDRKKETLQAIEKQWDELLSERSNLQSYFAFIEDLAVTKYSFPFHDLFYRERSIVLFGFRLPELVFWDLALDFPKTEKHLKDKYYIGNLVFVDRQEKGAEDILKRTHKPLIYVSLGTRWSTADFLRLQLLRKILMVAHELMQFEFVIAAGPLKDSLSSLQITSNICLLSVAPQLHLLSKASLMITHAGGNSIKECIKMGVPMLCFPFDNDQIGNAARVVFHGIGARGNNASSVEDIKLQVLNVLNSKGIESKLKFFQQRAVHDEVSNYAIRSVTRFLTVDENQ